MAQTNDPGPALARDADSFRLHAEHPTRMDMFVDAFAFAVTLPLLAFDAMASTIPGLIEARQQAPAFVPAFAVSAVPLVMVVRARASSGGWIGMPGFVHCPPDVPTPLMRRTRRFAALDA